MTVPTPQAATAKEGPDARTLLDHEQRRLAMLWKAFQQAEARIVELEGLLLDAKAALASADAGRAGLREEIIVLQTALEAALERERARADTDREQVTRVEVDRVALEASRADRAAADAEIARLRARIEELGSDAEQLRRLVADLQASLAAAQERADRQTDVAAKLRIELSTITADAASARTRASALEQELGLARARIAEVEADAERLRRLLADLQASLATARERAERESAATTELRIELTTRAADAAEARAHAFTLAEELASARTREEGYHTQIGDLRCLVRSLEERPPIDTEELERLRIEVREQAARASTLETRLVEAEGAVAEASGRADAAEASADAWRSRAMSAESRLASAEGLVVILQEELRIKPVPAFPAEAYAIGKIVEITPEARAKLRLYGVNFTDELLYIDLPRLSEATGIHVGLLRRWRDISELIAVHGIGPKWAVRLVDAGVKDILMLADLTPPQLAAMLAPGYEAHGLTAQRRRFLERTLPKRSEKLIRAAKGAAELLVHATPP